MTKPWEDALDDTPMTVCDEGGLRYPRATLRSTIERLTAERDKAQSDLEWANVTIEAMHLQQCPIAIVPPDECRAKADALCATEPKEDE